MLFSSYLACVARLSEGFGTEGDWGLRGGRKRGIGEKEEGKPATILLRTAFLPSQSSVNSPIGWNSYDWHRHGNFFGITNSSRRLVLGRWNRLWTTSFDWVIRLFWPWNSNTFCVVSSLDVCLPVWNFQTMRLLEVFPLPALLERTSIHVLFCSDLCEIEGGNELL